MHALTGMSNLRFKPAYNPYTEPSMEIFRYIQFKQTIIAKKALIKETDIEDKTDIEDNVSSAFYQLPCRTREMGRDWKLWHVQT